MTLVPMTDDRRQMRPGASGGRGAASQLGDPLAGRRRVTKLRTKVNQSVTGMMQLGRANVGPAMRILKLSSHTVGLGALSAASAARAQALDPAGSGAIV